MAATVQEVLRGMIFDHPYDVLESIGVKEKNFDALKHIIHRAYIFQGLNPRHCHEYDNVIQIENLVNLEEYAFQVYLAQTRDLDLSYTEIVNYVPILLNDNMSLRTLFALSANEFIDEVESRIPGKRHGTPLTIKNRGELGVHLWTHHPEDFMEAGMAEQSHSGFLRDVVMQGEIRYMLDPDTCKDYEKVLKPKNLKKLQEYGKKIWSEEQVVQIKRNKHCSYKRTLEDICFLLNNNVLMAKIVLLTPKEFHKLVKDVQYRVDNPPPEPVEEEKPEPVKSKVGRRPTPLSQVRESVKQREETKG